MAELLPHDPAMLRLLRLEWHLSGIRSFSD